jgi:FtsP/CotA-like multicopper oxidase with cupredoxin domain
MSTLNRREFLQQGLTVAGVAGIGLYTTACSPEALSPNAELLTTAPGIAGDLAEPSVIASLGGTLKASIVAQTAPTSFAGRTVAEPVTYGSTLPAPTLRVRPGDWVDLTFTNKIVFDQADTKPGYGRPPRETNTTNLHFHGMHVSPIGTADNMLVMVAPNGSHRYFFQIPFNHPAGLYWYHAHVHGLVTNHVGRGAAGMMYVENGYSDQIARMGIRRRLMQLQQAYFADDLRTLIFDDGARDDPNKALSLINGQLLPDIRIRPGEPQVWSLLNASSSAFYLLRLEKHTFDVIAEDGIPLPAPRLGQETLLMPSAKRLEVVVRGTAMPGRYTLSYDEYFQGVDTWPAKSVGTLVVDGVAWGGPDHPGIDISGVLPDLSGGNISKKLTRVLVLGQNDNVPEGEFGRFTINGHAWDPSYSEWTSKIGTVEEWVYRNETQQDHPMHVHTNPFQVVKINDVSVPYDGYKDTAIVPRFGTLTVRTKYTDFTGGPILVHCHILDHEDMGMMTRFEIA